MGFYFFKLKTKKTPHFWIKNVKKSHSVTANLQRVFSLLKGHNPALCSVCVGRRSGQHLSSKSSKSRIQNRIRATPELSSIPAEADHAKHHGEIAEEGSSAAGMAKLKNVLSFLDDEFNECKKTYQSLVREYEALADRAGGRDAFVSPTEMQEASQKLKVLSNELVDVIQNMELKVRFQATIQHLPPFSLSFFLV